ncbi:MAG TPA: DnaJ domain-containing protein [Rhodanobacteraceae bacterium]|nr:DnaJ domain-containing protein [Rhodanobacteraceae bacterium]
MAEAIELMLGLYRSPGLAPAIRRMELPDGITEIIRIAAGDADAAEHVHDATGLDAAEVREAAVLFLQQALFSEDADSYRVLGVPPDSAAAHIKEHHRWLIHWLHPDRDRAHGLDVFADRVNRAWNDLRNEERRRVYDSVRVVAPTGTRDAPRRQPLRATFDTTSLAAPAFSGRVVRHLPQIVLGGMAAVAALVLLLAFGLGPRSPLLQPAPVFSDVGEDGSGTPEASVSGAAEEAAASGAIEEAPAPPVSAVPLRAPLPVSKPMAQAPAPPAPHALPSQRSSTLPDLSPDGKEAENSTVSLVAKVAARSNGREEVPPPASAPQPPPPWPVSPAVTPAAASRPIAQSSASTTGQARASPVSSSPDAALRRGGPASESVPTSPAAGIAARRARTSGAPLAAVVSESGPNGSAVASGKSSNASSFPQEQMSVANSKTDSRVRGKEAVRRVQGSATRTGAASQAPASSVTPGPALASRTSPSQRSIGDESENSSPEPVATAHAPMAPVATARSLTTTQAQAAVDALLDAYRRGDIRSLLASFTGDVADGHLDTLAREYRELFAKSSRRTLAVRDLTWILDHDEAIGLGRFEATLVPRGGGPEHVTRGAIRVEVRLGSDGPRIVRLSHGSNS